MLGGQFGTNSATHKENDASGHQPVGQNAYEDGYGAPQVHHLNLVPPPLLCAFLDYSIMQLKILFFVWKEFKLHEVELLSASVLH